MLEEKLGWSLAGLVPPRVEIGGRSLDITDCENLVYSAHRHNTLVRYLVVVPETMDVAGLAE